MDGRWLALGSVAAIAAAGVVRHRRGALADLSFDPDEVTRVADLRNEIVTIIMREHGVPVEDQEDTWDFELSQFGLTPRMTRQIEHLVGHPVLGHGASRIVFRLTDDLVLKLALDVVGREGNETEAYAWWDSAEDPEVRDFLVPIVEVGPEGCWLVMEYAEPITGRPRLRREANRRLIRWEELVADERPGARTGDIDQTTNWGLHEGVVRLVDYEYPP